MAEVDQKALADTLRRIKSSLNKRYEKDAELYISYQDTLEIKKDIYEHNYPAIQNLITAGRISPATMGKVIAKNLWLVADAKEKELKQIEQLLKSCPKAIFQELVQSIQNGTADISPTVREFIIVLFYKQADLSICNEYLLKKETKNNKLLKVCFTRCVSTFKLSKDFRKINNYLSVNPVLGNESGLLSEIYDSFDSSQKENFKKYLIEKIENTSTNLEMVFREVLRKIPGAIEFMCKRLTKINDSYVTLQKQRYIDYDISNNYLSQFRSMCHLLQGQLQSMTEEKDLIGAMSPLSSCYKHVCPKLQDTIVKECIEKAKLGQKEYELVRETFRKKTGAKFEQDKNSGTIDKSITSAKDVVEWMEDPDHKPGKDLAKWSGWAVNMTIYKRFKGRRQVEILSSLILDFSEKHLFIATVLPYIIEFYVGNIREGNRDDEDKFNTLISFLDDYRSGKLQQKAKGKVQTLLNNIENIIIRKAIQRNLRIGGINGVWYSFLYDYRRSDCKKLFDN